MGGGVRRSSKQRRGNKKITWCIIFKRMIWVTFHPPAESLTDISDGLGSVKPVFVGHHCGIDREDYPEGCGHRKSLSAWQTGGRNCVHDRINHENDDNVDEKSPQIFDKNRVEKTKDCGLQESHQSIKCQAKSR